MISLVETGLMNALLAVVLALPVFALGRICHRPALIHAFWILVLIKLIAPPLYLIPVPVSLPAQVSAVSDGIALSAPTLHTALSHVPVNSQVIENSWTVNWQIYATYSLQFLQRLAWPILILWLLGSICWFAWQGWCVVRFTQIFLKYARRGPPVLQNLAQRLAQQMGIPRAPEVWLLPAVVSPMLWSVGGKPRILFPKDLLSRLDEGAVATLLTHELAHYRRGDHRVRLLEFLASGLFWWHPVIWLARRELEISEEKCCDAWVVSQFPAAQRQYADALLATVDFLTENHPTLPATACGLGEVPLLRQRLKLIMRGTAPKSLSLLGRAAVVATAMLIPISPSLKLREQAPVLEAATTPAATTQQASSVSTSPNVTFVNIHTAPDVPLAPAASATDSGKATESDLVAADSTTIASDSGCGTTPIDPTTGNEPTSAPMTSPPGSSPAVTTAQVIDQSQDHRSVAARGRQDFLDLATSHNNSLIIVANGNVSLTGSCDGTIQVWELRHSPINAPVTAESSSTQGALSESSCEAKKNSDTGDQDFVTSWDVSELQKLGPVTRVPHGVPSLSVSPQGLTLATSFGKRNSKNSAVLLARFSANGKLLVATEWRGLLLTWDLGTQVRITK